MPVMHKNNISELAVPLLGNSYVEQRLIVLLDIYALQPLVWPEISIAHHTVEEDLYRLCAVLRKCVLHPATN